MSDDLALAGRYALQAHGEFKSGGILLDEGDALIAGTICYLSHQAAEKILKAYILCHEEEHLRTHDLLSLLDVCEKYDPSLDALREPCEDLNDYQVSARYPDDLVVFDLEDAAIAVRHCEAVMDAVASKLPFSVPE